MSALKNIKILVVDDDAMLRELIGEIFSQAGADVVEAENCAIAFSLIQKHCFDVVFSDVRMPGGDGILLAKNISTMKVQQRPAVFFCSGFNDLTPQMIKELNIIRVFDKPFDSDHLITEISAHLKNVG